MAWFFTENEINDSFFVIEGKDADHIGKSLRMKKGEEITLVTPLKKQHNCIIDEVEQGRISVKIRETSDCANEPDVEITLYQALPKGDKMDYIVQKSVELGVSRIVPVVSARCISRPDNKSLSKKVARWQKIAKEAAQQSRRGIIPEVSSSLSFKEAVVHSKNNQQNIIFYECGGEKVKDIVKENPKSIGIFIGSEGGFEEKEVEMVIENQGKAGTLGKRILRAETAPLAALSVIMFATGNFD